MSESDAREGEILKASSPGQSQLEPGMEVHSLDGERLGTVKEIRESEFLVDRPLAHDLWIPMSAILATEDYTGNFRGPVQPDAIVLTVSSAHIDAQGWPRA